MRSRKRRWVGHVACIGGMRNACKILVRKQEEERRGEGVGWMHVVQDRDQWQALVNKHKNGPLSSIKGWTFIDYLSDYYFLKKYCFMELVH
jgi:hypothetical protein